MQRQNDSVILEMVLRLWENTSFMEEFIAIAEERIVDPAVHNWPDFRDYLLRYRAGDTFDSDRFIGKDTRYLSQGLTKDAPELIATWIAHSKRIFRISAAMQDRFSKIGFGNLRASDIVLPFPSFGVQLTNPIVSDGVEFSFVLVTQVTTNLGANSSEKINCLWILAFPKSAMEYGGLDSEECLSVLRDIGKPNKTERTLKKGLALAHTFQQMAQKFSAVDGLLVRDGGEELLESFFSAQHVSTMDLREVKDSRVLRKTHFDLYESTVMRTIFNLCLYLQSLPASAIHEEGVDWKAEYQNKIGGSLPGIVKRTEVCDIIGHHIIDGMVVDRRSAEARSGGWQMEPMWRRAHRRRAPGKGSDPAAEKSVKVRHYLIREDLAAEGRPIRGSLAEVR